MRRLYRFLATLVVLVGLVPCELREVVPVVGGVAATCCPAAEPTGEPSASDAGSSEEGVDCCDGAACRGLARVTAPAATAASSPDAGYLLVDRVVRVDRPSWRSGPPPTPPPIG